MCGRYARRSDKQKLAEAFHLGKLPPDFALAPDYNVAPTSFQPVIRLNAETGERELTQMRWGLIPYWSQDDKIAFKTINARAETVATNNVFKEAFKRRHCTADPAVEITKRALEGWDVQQIFTGETPGQAAETFALLKRKRS